MILVDTSIWIDFLRNTNQSLSERLIEYLENGMAVGLSSVFGELLQGARTDEEEKLIFEFWDNLPKPDERSLFIEAGKLSREHKLMEKGVGLVGCYFLAAARINNYKIWTLDKRLFDAYVKIQL